MNDPIKEFVEQNRAAFDELEAPPFNLEAFKERLNPAQGKKTKRILLHTKWLVAASVLIVLGTTFLMLKEYNKSSDTDKLANSIHKKPVKIKPAVKHEEIKIASLVTPEARPIVAEVYKKPNLKKHLESDPQPDSYAKLSDSSSSSIRLAAILDIEKSGQISNDVLDRLAKTLNHDENSNVRLAALSVLEKYSYDAHVAALLIHSLSIQNDPLVQLGLVSLLGKMKNLNINDKLYALAYDPNTFGAVKDEAYSILLKDDKL
ncbi:hypothetical protein [Pedobacter rhodius]|uniref:HEAT repeat domain-containing protein n=1 Tax=Pedobacter rhodius TaxID=3004098 RepID=A0ABT4KXZ7_9SPHI|nr:hypothetical protein [Pedobacter sp. SJ11]MCZ4223811.1 hypothetical protein [Pedobacter sp. SJ11]